MRPSGIDMKKVYDYLRLFPDGTTRGIQFGTMIRHLVETVLASGELNEAAQDEVLAAVESLPQAIELLQL